MDKCEGKGHRLEKGYPDNPQKFYGGNGGSGGNGGKGGNRGNGIMKDNIIWLSLWLWVSRQTNVQCCRGGTSLVVFLFMPPFTLTFYYVFANHGLFPLLEQTYNPTAILCLF